MENKEIKIESSMEERFIEKGADQEHERWAKWQKYFFSKCVIKSHDKAMDGRFIYFALSKDRYELWLRQINTPYSELSEEEKESDRKEVRKYLPLIQSEIDLAVAKREKEILESIREYAEPYDGSKWLNEVNAQKIINLITNK